MSDQTRPPPPVGFTRNLRVGSSYLCQQSPALGLWIGKYGPCKLEVDWERSLFEALVRAIAHQQLHGRAAATILSRLCAGFRGGDFPTPAQLQRASTDKLRGMGFSSAKVLAIQGIAAAAAAGEIPDREEASRLDDEELVQRLIPLRGVGRWTVEMLMIFSLGRLDIMPVDDFGIKSGLQQLLELRSFPKKADFDELTADWKPYRSIAAWYLWRKADAGK